VNQRSAALAATHSTAPTLDLARELIARKSPTPDDAGCQDILRARGEASLAEEIAAQAATPQGGKQ